MNIDNKTLNYRHLLLLLMFSVAKNRIPNLKKKLRKIKKNNEGG